jgi:sulfonate transport system permease protein
MSQPRTQYRGTTARDAPGTGGAGGVRATRAPPARRLVGRFGVEAWLPVTLLAAWWVLSEASTSTFFPPLREILARIGSLWSEGTLAEDLTSSLTNMAAGFAVAVACGVALGTGVYASRALHDALYPIIHFLRSMPKPALLPAFIVVLGLGAQMKIGFIALGALWPVLLNTLDGLAGKDPMLDDVAETYRLRRRDLYLRVALPAALPQIFAGLRTGLQLALILMIISEMVASTQGLGYLILYSQMTFQTTDMWAGMVLLGVLGYTLNTLFTVVERRALWWYLAQRAAGGRNQ